jgi:hypothetical protein
MVAGNHQHRDPEGANGGAGGGDGGFRGLRGIEEVSRNENEARAGLPGMARNGLERVQPLLLKAVPLRLVADRGERLAELPVSGVKEDEVQGRRRTDFRELRETVSEDVGKFKAAKIYMIRRSCSLALL